MKTYKATIVLGNEPFEPYFLASKELISSIWEKIITKEIDLPFIPTIGMLIDLGSFSEDLEFTEEETEAIKDGNELFEIVSMNINKYGIELFVI